jgi:hypothetical protein
LVDELELVITIFSVVTATLANQAHDKGPRRISRAEALNRSAKARKLLRAIDEAAIRHDLLEMPSEMLRVVETWGDYEWNRVARRAGYPVDDIPRTSRLEVARMLQARIGALAALREAGCQVIGGRIREFAACQYLGDERGAQLIIEEVRAARKAELALGVVLACAESARLEQATPKRYLVRYYDAAKSRKGQGVQQRSFTDRADAESFASQNKLYAKPCKVEEVPA